MLQSFLDEVNDLFRFSFNCEKLLPSIWPPPAWMLENTRELEQRDGGRQLLQKQNSISDYLVVTCQCSFVLGINNSSRGLLGMQWLASMACYICSAAR